MSPKQRTRKLCAWGSQEGCSEPADSGRFGNFCREHADILAAVVVAKVSAVRPARHLRNPRQRRPSFAHLRAAKFGHRIQTQTVRFAIFTGLYRPTFGRSMTSRDAKSRGAEAWSRIPVALPAVSTNWTTYRQTCWRLISRRSRTKADDGQRWLPRLPAQTLPFRPRLRKGGARPGIYRPPLWDAKAGRYSIPSPRGRPAAACAPLSGAAQLGALGAKPNGGRYWDERVCFQYAPQANARVLLT